MYRLAVIERLSMLAVRLVVAACGLAFVLASCGGSDGSATITELDISIFNNYFEPAEIVVSSGVPITVKVTNDEAVGTQFSIHDLAILGDVYESEADYKDAIEADPSVVLAMTDRLAPGSSTNLAVTFPSAGVYQVVCTIPGHVDIDKMTGIINVEG